jgi:hypothetical protein
MFRSDRDALAGQVDDLRSENERFRAQNEAMRADLLTRRAAQPAQVDRDIYKSDLSHLTPGERAALSEHRLQFFPVWATLLLHVATFGLSSLVHFNLLHDRLPRAQHNDPTAAKGLGFSFIPYFHFYWYVWNPVRLTDRINLQFRLRGLPEGVPRWLTIVAGVLTVVPYFGLLAAPIIWFVMAIFLQRGVNRLAELGDEGRLREARVDARVGVPGVRIPAVRDLQAPDEVAAAAEADAEVDAAPARRRL